MDGFGDNFDQAEVDPAAEFLAREQNELAGLDDDLAPAASNGPTPVLTNDEDPFGLPRTQDEDQDPFSSFGQPQVAPVPVDFPEVKTDVNFEGDNFGETLQDKIESVSTAEPFQDEVQNSLEGQIKIETPSPAHRPTPVREVPENIKKWREEQKKRLEEKDENEDKKREEWREAAKKELEEWYRHHDDLIAKTRAANRNAEKQFVADDDEIEPGTEWERIAKHCDFNPKASKGSKDVSRMRSIILQLKQNPLPINGVSNKRS